MAALECKTLSDRLVPSCFRKKNRVSYRGGGDLPLPWLPSSLDQIYGNHPPSPPTNGTKVLYEILCIFLQSPLRHSQYTYLVTLFKLFKLCASLVSILWVWLTAHANKCPELLTIIIFYIYSMPLAYTVCPSPSTALPINTVSDWPLWPPTFLFVLWSVFQNWISIQGGRHETLSLYKTTVYSSVVVHS